MLLRNRRNFIKCVIFVTFLFYFVTIINFVNEPSSKKSDAADNDRIFFHETSGRLELSLRQSCAIESAAYHNPQRPVQIYFQPQLNNNAGINSSSAWFQVLHRYPNVRIIVIDDVELYFRDSPVEDWYLKGQWRGSPYKTQHMADYIRLVSLYKQGGMFLDLDIVTIKSYDDANNLFRNFFLIESERKNLVTNAVFHLNRGHQFMDAIFKVMKLQEYEPDDYIFNGPRVVSKAWNQFCNNKSSKKCPDGVRLLSHRFFNPVPNWLCNQYFEPATPLLLDKIKASYGFHLWNSVSKKFTIDVTTDNSSQVYAILASEHCPITWTFRKQFSIN